jgi:hypothetical protein
MRRPNNSIRVLAALLAGSTVVNAGDAPLSVCDVLARRAELNHKVIAIRGVELSTDEGSWLTSPSCASTVIQGREWPAMIWIELGTTDREKAGFHAEPYDTEVKQIQAELEKQHYDPKRHQMWLTFIGRFETYNDLGPRSRGFGQLSSAPAAIIVNEVRDLVLRDTKTQLPSKKGHQP